MSTMTESEFFGVDGEFEGALGSSAGTAHPSPALLMEHLGSLAAHAESEAEAEAFLGALVPLATSLLPSIARAAPQLVRGVARVGTQLWRNPRTRRLVATVPQVVQRSAADLARQVGRGRPLTAQAVTRSIARQVSTVLDEPAARRRAIQRCRALDRRWHATQRTAAAPGAPMAWTTPATGPAPSGVSARACTCQ
jgi:hypothetical protein